MPRAVPISPPAARASAVLERRPAIERELSDLKQQIGEAVLAGYEDKPGSREALIALDSNIRALTLQLDSNDAAHKLALSLDADAKAEWRAAIEAADPKEMTAGIGKKTCCTRCSPEHGCIISGGTCAHPITVGSVGHQHQSNQPVRELYRAAGKRLGVYHG